MRTKLFFTVVLIIMAISTSYAQSVGYEKSIEINGGVGLDNNSKYGFGISMVNGYRFSDYFYLGAGVGYKSQNSLYFTSTINYNYYESFDSRNLVQFYARAKANLSNAKIAPFLQLDLGSSIDINSNKEAGTSNGLVVEPAFGVDFKTNDPKTAIYFSIGYNIQSMSYAIISDNTVEDSSAGQLVFRVGFKF
ncbi:MAG: outer membrane beta-barrel protein [Rikenellaceae bacterium]